MRTILVSSCFILLLSGCGNNDTATAEKEPPKIPAAEAPAPKPVAVVTESKTAAWKGVQEITDAEFNSKVLKNTGLTVVDFNATWCGPCKALKPLFDKASDKFAGKASFASMDVDQNPAVSQQFQIQSIPLLLFFKEGKVVNKIIGLVSGAELNKAIEQSL